MLGFFSKGKSHIMEQSRLSLLQMAYFDIVTKTIKYATISFFNIFSEVYFEGFLFPLL